MKYARLLFVDVFGLFAICDLDFVKIGTKVMSRLAQEYRKLQTIFNVQEVGLFLIL